MARDKFERARRGDAPAPKSTRRPAFATVPATVLATRRLRELPGSAVRVLLWLESAWHPDRGAAAPQAHVASALHMRRSTVRGAIRALVETGLIEPRCAAVRPGRMGDGRRGQAASYDLPHRRPGSVVRFDPGDRKLPGFFKLYAADLRELAARLSDSGARVLVIAAAVPRSRTGEPAPDAKPLDLSGGRLAQALPGLSARSANRAVQELRSLGLITATRPRAGSRGALYAPSGLLATRIARTSSRAVLHGSVQGGSPVARKRPDRDGELRVSARSGEPGSDFRAKRGPVGAVFAPFGTQGKKLPVSERTARACHDRVSAVAGGTQAVHRVGTDTAWRPGLGQGDGVASHGRAQARGYAPALAAARSGIAAFSAARPQPVAAAAP
jgi:hypothetical protein